MDAFEEEIRNPDFQLTRACLLLARDERPDVDVDAYLDRFDDWAARVQDAAAERGFLDALTGVLADEVGFRGNTTEYYDPDNSLLDRVIDRRLGIPITLGVVYLEVARRLEAPLVAVGMPGHFLLRYEARFIDPFQGGREVTRDECEAIVRRIFGPDAELTDAMLQASPDQDVLTRVLTNLKNAYVRAGDLPRAVRVLDRALQLNPLALQEYRDRGLLRKSLGDAAGARNDLRRYLDGLPEADDAPAIRQLLERL